MLITGIPTQLPQGDAASTKSRTAEQQKAITHQLACSSSLVMVTRWCLITFWALNFDAMLFCGLTGGPPDRVVKHFNNIPVKAKTWSELKYNSTPP